MSSSHSSRKVRTFFAAALLACATARAVVKPAVVAAHVSAHAATPVSYEAKSAALSDVQGMTKHEAAVTAPSAMRRHLPSAAASGYGTNARTENKISPLSPVTPTSPITPSIDLPSIIPSQPAPGAGQTTDAYAVRTDFGKSNLHKWSSVYGMDTPWDENDVTDTKNFKSSTIAFLDTLNTLAQSAGVSFVLTGGAEYGYHAHGTYSHENGYKVDISDSGVYAARRPTASSPKPSPRSSTTSPMSGATTTTTSRSTRPTTRVPTPAPTTTTPATTSKTADNLPYNATT